MLLKKPPQILGVLIFFALLTAIFSTGTAFSADTAEDESVCNLFVCGSLASKLQLNIPDADWGDTFGITTNIDDPKKDYIKKVGKDLYKKVYSMTSALPERKAFKNITGKYGTTESKMVLLLNNNFSPILDQNPNLTQEQALNKMLEIQQQFAEEKELTSLEADIKSTVEINEIFANGNVGDSGFDLINDLDNIQNILFKKIDPIDIGGTYDESGESPVGKEKTSKTPAATPETPAYKGIVESAKAPGAAGTSVLPLTSAADDSISSKTIPSLKSEKSSAAAAATSQKKQNANICILENNLTKALRDFTQNKAKDSRFKETPTLPAGSAAASDDGKAKTPFSTSVKTAAEVGTTGASIPEFTYRETVAPPAKFAPADDWRKKLPCNDIFCLKVNFVKKPVIASYRDHDNCIACHIEKIDAKLKETINHSLVPAKATGNLLEPGVCKSAALDLFNSVGLRFHAVTKPVLTPTNDDLIYGSSIVNEWENFINIYKPLPFFEKSAAQSKSADTNESPPKEAEKAALKALTETNPESTQSDIIKKINEQIDKDAQERQTAISVAETAIKSDVDSGFYQAIQRELEQMNAYFASFRDILESLHKRDAGASGACELLKSKKECT